MEQVATDNARLSASTAPAMPHKSAIVRYTRRIFPGPSERTVVVISLVR